MGKAEALALRVFVERIECGENHPMAIRIGFVAG
jgi:hypothetical protein